MGVEGMPEVPDKPPLRAVQGLSPCRRQCLPDPGQKALLRKDRRRPRRRLHNKAFPIKRTSTYLSRSAQIILLSFCTIATPEVASSSFLLLKTCYFMRLLATVPLENHRGNSLIVWPLECSIATSPLTCHGQTPLWIASSQLAPTLSFLKQHTVAVASLGAPSSLLELTILQTSQLARYPELR